MTDSLSISPSQIVEFRGINYTLIEKTLPSDVLKPYYNLLQPFFRFEASVSCYGDGIVFWSRTWDDDLKETWVEMSVDEWNAGVYTRITPDPTYHVLAYPIDETSVGYLYKKNPKKVLDEFDTAFQRNPNVSTVGHTVIKLILHGLHTYGGYHGFFHPDLCEVAHLIQPVVSLESVKRIYVTTDPHPSDNINEIYDNKHNRHRARTTVYIIREIGGGENDSSSVNHRNHAN